MTSTMATFAYQNGGTPTRVRYLKVSAAQREYLLDFMEEHLEFAAGKQDLKSKVAAGSMWLRLKRELDALGPPNEVLVWKRVWLCMQKEAKKRIEVLKNSGEDPDTLFPTNEDKRILELVKYCEAKADNLSTGVVEAIVEGTAKAPGENDINTEDSMDTTSASIDSPPAAASASSATTGTPSPSGDSPSAADYISSAIEGTPSTTESAANASPLATDASPLATDASPLATDASPLAADTSPLAADASQVAANVSPSLADASLSTANGILPAANGAPSIANHGVSDPNGIPSANECTLLAASPPPAFVNNTNDKKKFKTKLFPISTTEDQPPNSDKLSPSLMKRQRKSLRENPTEGKLTDTLRKNLKRYRAPRNDVLMNMMQQQQEQHQEQLRTIQEQHHKDTEALLRMLKLMEAQQEQHMQEMLQMQQQRRQDQELLMSALTRLEHQQDQVQLLVQVLLQQTGTQVIMQQEAP